jgi:lipopolysaccharide transport system ATP-binding protein
MTRPVIKVEDLSKAYRIGFKEQIPDTLVAAIFGLVKAPARKFREIRRLDTYQQNGHANDTIWALKDVSFEVADGEVLGIIGRNGAGKSTLLKILSRITEPTSGRAVIRGRVSSLLEVGTGFHPELTGRENVYMNGTILGMSKREIDRKFDEIVAFSGVEKFLDTPIKRYSSGMNVRLAFAVAAHLEPEILVVDEVLAVGDVEFQKKCMGKMQDVARGGRTILFVSHNMNAVSSLCDSAIMVCEGKAGPRLPTEKAIGQYFGQEAQLLQDGSLEARSRFQLSKRTYSIRRMRVLSSGIETRVIPSCAPVTFELELRGLADLPRAECGIIITDQIGQRVLALQSRYHAGLVLNGDDAVVLSCELDSLPLVPAPYYIDLVLASGSTVVERVERAARFDVVFADVFGTGWIPTSGQGFFVHPCTWNRTTLGGY